MLSVVVELLNILYTYASTQPWQRRRLQNQLIYFLNAVVFNLQTFLH